MMRRLVQRLARRLARPPCAAYTVEVADLDQLMRLLGWTRKPILDQANLDVVDNVEDANQRRLRDAEVVGAACANIGTGSFVEIGTAHGDMTVVMAQNAPSARIYTVNIPPEDISAGGHFTTFAPQREHIGERWRAAGCTNVEQILANTATWRPALERIDLAFIDGCHDEAFVRSDTRLMLERARPGTVLLWHDFHPGLIHRHAWIEEVCNAVEDLFRAGILRGHVFHLRDSWVGLHVVGGTR